MSQYLFPIKSAILLFPLIAGCFTVPYLILQYRKYGAVLILRAMIVYSFILYLLCAYFLVILPLPSIESVANSTNSMLILEPFAGVKNFLQNTYLVLNDPSTYLPALKQNCFYEPVGNFFLLFPFGVYLRYYFKRSWWQVLLLSFFMSLFYELTQLSGLYGVYPRPYRYFQTDDLILNSVGGLVGCFCTPLFSFFLPTKDRLDARSYSKGKQVSTFRRVFACAIDWGFMTAILWLFGIRGGLLRNFGVVLTPNWKTLFLYIVAVIGYFMLIPWLIKGRTIGKVLVGIKIIAPDGGSPKFRQYLIRYSLLYGIIIPAPFLTIRLFTLLTMASGMRYILVLILLIMMGLISISFVFHCLVSMATGQVQLFYDRISRTEHVSTVKPQN